MTNKPYQICLTISLIFCLFWLEATVLGSGLWLGWKVLLALGLVVGGAGLWKVGREL